MAAEGSGHFTAETGMVFAGSGTESTIAVPLSTEGLVKFGPGVLLLAADIAEPWAALSGGVLVSSGILAISNGRALGPGASGDDVLVAAGAVSNCKAASTCRGSRSRQRHGRGQLRWAL